MENEMKIAQKSLRNRSKFHRFFIDFSAIVLTFFGEFQLILARDEKNEKKKSIIFFTVIACILLYDHGQL